MKRIAAVLIFAAGFGFIAFASLNKRNSNKQVTEKKADKDCEKKCSRTCMLQDI
jgi:hypothetical protein